MVLLRHPYVYHKQPDVAGDFPSAAEILEGGNHGDETYSASPWAVHKGRSKGGA